MRVSSCNCHHPLVCCSASSLRHCSLCPTKSKPADTQKTLSSPPQIAVVVESSLAEEKVQAEQRSLDDGKVQISLKSSLKKPGGSCAEAAAKGNIKWMDLLGKELVEIKEFEPSESGDSDYDMDGNTSCTCTIQ